MALTNIIHLAGAWAELVAFSPALTIFDSGDVEILNENIPEYDGPAGIVGTVLALIMCALGAVKTIYRVNEGDLRKRRNVQPTLTNSDLYFRIAYLIDRQQCAALFTCSVALQAQNLTKLDPSKRLIVDALGRNHVGDERTRGYNWFSDAFRVGRSAKSRKECDKIYSKCPYSQQTLEGAFKMSQKFTNRRFVWLNNLAKKISLA